jgi:DNA-binding beta-propeller fold protein YncE
VIALALLAAAATAQPQTVLTIDPKHRLVEGVTSDGTTIWVSSILDRQILACRKTCRTLATLPAGIHPFAIAWDASRKRLWVAADCPPGVAAIKACDRGALMALSTTGKVMTRIAPPTGSFHPGDVSASPAGVFVSDSQNGAVYRLSKDGYSLSPVVEPGVGKSAQGTALDEAGGQLLVVDYSQGIATVDLATNVRTLLPRQDGKPLRGIDGLTRCGSTYYGIYNGAAPGLLVSINRNTTGIEFGQPLGDLTLPDPTQLAFDGKRLLIVADSGWATIDKPDFKRTAGTPIIAVPLNADCAPE